MKIAEINHDIKTDTITIVIAKNDIWNAAIEAAANVIAIDRRHDYPHYEAIEEIRKLKK